MSRRPPERSTSLQQKHDANPPTPEKEVKKKLLDFQVQVQVRDKHKMSAALALPAAASLVDQLDKKVLILLRDGRHLVGIMRSFDQFSNVVLEETFERRVVVSEKGSKSLVCSKRA